MRRMILLLLVLTYPHSGILRSEDQLPRDGSRAPVRSPSAAIADSKESYSPVRTGLSRYRWDWLANRYDQDKDGIVTQRELPISKNDFLRLDRTWDGELTASDFDWSAEGALCRQKETTFALFKSTDTTSDGRISADEFQALFAKVTAEKGYLDEEDLERLIYLPRVIKTRNELRTRALHATFQSDEHGILPVNLPKPGDLAPDFELQSPDGKTTVRLSSFKGVRPVVLIFGCLTCGNYRTYSQNLEDMYRLRKGKVEFLRVYVREAHPIDDRAASETNAKANILIRQPKTLAERCEIATRCVQDLDVQTPMVVDGIDNQVGRAYGGWPDRLYLIDRDGRVAFQGGPGPFAFNPRELEQNLLMLLLDQESSVKDSK